MFGAISMLPASFSLAGPQSSYCRQIVAALLLHTKATMFRRTVCRSCKVWLQEKTKAGSGEEIAVGILEPRRGCNRPAAARGRAS